MSNARKVQLLVDGVKLFLLFEFSSYFLGRKVAKTSRRTIRGIVRRVFLRRDLGSNHGR